MSNISGLEVKTEDQPQTRHQRGQQWLTDAMMCFPEVEERSTAVLSSLISSLEESEWQSIRYRMREPLSQTHLAQVSERIIRAVSQLISQLIAPTPNVQLQPEEEPKKSESDKEPQRFVVACRPSALVLHKYFQVSEETLAQSLDSTTFNTRAVLGDVVKQLNQGLYALVAQNQDGTDTQGSEVMSAARKLLGLAGETLAEKTAVQDLDTFSKKATAEVMSAVADCVSCCQDKVRKSGRILHDLKTKITKQCSETAEQQSTVEVERIDVCTYPLFVSSEKVNSDLSESRGTCLQVLKGLLAKFLALFCPRSLSLMTGPHRSSLPALESVSSNMLDVVDDAVKGICLKKKSRFHLKHKVKEERINTAATEVKLALHKKLCTFLTRYKEAVEEVNKDKMEKLQTTVSTLLSMLRDKTAEWEHVQEVQKSRVQTVRTLLDQIYSADGNKLTLVRLEELIDENKLSSVCQLLIRPTTSEQIHCFSEAAVKHQLTLLLLPPPSWGMGRVIQVQSSPSSTARFAESTQLYDRVISLYTQVMCDQVMSSLRGSSATFGVQLEVERFLDELKIEDGALMEKKKRK